MSRRKGTKIRHGAVNRNIIDKYTKKEQRRFPPYSNVLDIARDDRKKTSSEMKGVIDLWIRTELSSFLKKHLHISTSTSRQYHIETNSHFTMLRRSGHITINDDALHVSCSQLEINSFIEYTDPEMFTRLEQFISRIYNG